MTVISLIQARKRPGGVIDLDLGIHETENRLEITSVPAVIQG